MSNKADKEKLDKQKAESIKLEKERRDYIKSLNVIQKLSLFQQENIEILKTSKAYGYKYATLDDILDILTPYLKKYNLIYNHYIESVSYENKITGEINIKNVVVTRVYNFDDIKDYTESSTVIDDEVVLAKMNKFMVIGSAVTYFRRYHIVTMFGLTTDEDSDAGGKPMKVTTNETNPTSKPSGRSVELSKSEDNLDYLSIFKGLIDRGKTKQQVEKSLKNYKAKIAEPVFIEISQLIIDNFKEDKK